MLNYVFHWETLLGCEITHWNGIRKVDFTFLKCFYFVVITNKTLFSLLVRCNFFVVLFFWELKQTSVIRRKILLCYCSSLNQITFDGNQHSIGTTKPYSPHVKKLNIGFAQVLNVSRKPFIYTVLWVTDSITLS